MLEKQLLVMGTEVPAKSQESGHRAEGEWRGVGWRIRDGGEGEDVWDGLGRKLALSLAWRACSGMSHTQEKRKRKGWEL